MKSQSLTKIRDRALYNIYGDTAPVASISARAQYELLAILENVQREHTFYFSKQKTTVSLPSGSSSVRITLQNDGNADDSIGEIYDVIIKDADRKIIPRFISRREIYMVTLLSGTPGRWSWAPKSEVYTAGVPTISNDNLLFDRIADKDYTIDVFFKQIFMPVDWTNPTVFMAWTSLALDELEEYLTAQLTFNIAVIAGNQERMQMYAAISQKALNALYAKTDSKDRQVGDHIFTYKDM